MPIKRPLSRPAHLEKYRGKPELLKGKTVAEMKGMLLSPEFSIDQQGSPGYPKPTPSRGGVDRRSLLKERGEKIPPVEPIPNMPKRKKRKPQAI